MRYVDDYFNSSFITTIGIDFKIKTLIIDDVKYKLQIWDTSGQERFKTITRAYYRGALGVILCYDISNRISFNRIKNWLQVIKQEVDEKSVKILCANKIDCGRQVLYEEGLELANENNMKFYELSAKDNININEMFHQLTIDIIKQLDSIPLEIINEEQVKKSCC